MTPSLIALRRTSSRAAARREASSTSSPGVGTSANSTRLDSISPSVPLSRSREGEYEEYHSSADDLELVRPQHLEEALQAVLEILDVLETDRRYVNLAPKGEPQLGRRGLYPQVGGPGAAEEQLAMLWVLNQSDGTCSLLDIAERSGLPFSDLRAAAQRLHAAGLLAEAELGA